METAFKRNYIVVGIGEILWDILPDGKRLGGAPANFALHSHCLGAQAKIISSLGRDQAGLEILQQLSQKQISAEFIQTNGHPTGWVDVKILNEGLPAYVIHDSVAWDYILFSSEIEKLARTCNAVCFGTLAQRNPVSGRSIHKFLANSKENCLRVFDVNLRKDYFSRDIIESSLQAANVLKLNDDELTVLQDLLGLPLSSELALQTLLERYSLEFIAFTQGATGSIMMDKNNVSHCPGTPVEVKDTIGAGDAFTATMVMGKLYGLPLDKINRLASKVAAHVCSQAGATPTLPSYLISELKQELSVPIRKIVDPLPAHKTQQYGLGKTNQSTL